MSDQPLQWVATEPAPIENPSTVTLEDQTGVFLQILDKLGCSIALSTDESRLMIIGAKDAQPTLSVLVLPRLRGVAVQNGLLAVSSAGSVHVYRAVAGLGPAAPYAKDVYDTVYTARAIHITGRADLHDMAFVNGAIVAVNTRYSCVCIIDGRHSFTPIWKPPFISALRPEDRCHLNGMAVEGGKLRYVTLLGVSDKPQGWRETCFTDGGVLLEAHSGREVASGLSLPHSPRVIHGGLYCLESGRGLVLRLDPASGDRTVIARLPGFTHGLAEYAGVLFVATSKLRLRRPENPLPLEADFESLIVSVAAIDLRTQQVLGAIELKGGVAEVFDLQVLAGVRHAEIREAEQFSEHQAIEMPNESFWVSDKDAFR